MLTVAELSRLFSCGADRIKAQHAKNAAALGEMHSKAVKTGKNVNGYSAEQLLKMQNKAIALSR